MCYPVIQFVQLKVKKSGIVMLSFVLNLILNYFSIPCLAWKQRKRRGIPKQIRNDRGDSIIRIIAELTK